MNISSRIKELACQGAIKLIYIWLYIERLLIKFIFFSAVKKKVSQFYLLDDANKSLITVHDDEFYVHTANKSLLGCCESYMNGWITITQPDVAIANVIQSGKVQSDLGYRYKAFIDYLIFDFFYNSSSDKSIQMADTHYNLGKLLFNKKLILSINYL